MRALAITAIVFALIPFILARPYIGVLAWSWIGYMNPHRLAYGFAYSFPFALVVGVATIAGLLFSKEQKSIPWTPVTVVLVLFIVWMSVTTAFALYPEEAVAQWQKVLKIQLMVFITLMIVKDKMRIHWLVWVIALSIGFYGIKGGIFSILTGGQYRVWGPDRTFIAGNNEIAFALCVVLPLFRYLQLTLEARWARWAIGMAMFLCAISILASYSRGALVAGSVMTMLLLLKSRRKFTLALALAVAIPTLVSFMPDKWSNRMETIQTYEEDASAMGRINAWKFAFNLALDRPIVGGGYETFQPDLFRIYAPDPEDYHDSHSIYFEVMGEHGFAGLALYLVLIVLAFRAGSWVITRTRGDKELRWAYDLGSMLQVSLVGYLVGGAFIGLAYFDLFYHLVAMLVILKVLVEGAKRPDCGAEREQGSESAGGRAAV